MEDTGPGVAPVVSIVVVTLDPGPDLRRLVESVAAATTHPHEVIVADNGSTDGTPEWVESAPGVRLVRTGGNIGYGSAVNRAAAVARGQFLLACNSDLLLAPGSVDELLASAHRHPDAGAFGPAILQPDGSLYPSARAQPSLLVGSLHALLGSVAPGNRWSRAYRGVQQGRTEREAGWLSGACVLLRRTAFDQVGGFDERYFMYFEDVDLGDRLNRAGWPSVYVPTAEVTHVGGVTTARAPVRMLEAHHRSAALFLADRYPAVVARPLDRALAARQWFLTRRAGAGR